MTLIDSSIFFDENSIEHILQGAINSLNLNHIFKNENYITMDFSINGQEIDIEGGDAYDTLFYNPSIDDPNLYTHSLTVQNILSNIEYESGEFTIYLTAKDQTGNIKNEEISYTIQTNMEDIII